MTRHVHRAVLTAVAVLTSALTAVLAVGATTEPEPVETPSVEEVAEPETGLDAVVAGPGALADDPVAAFVDRLTGTSDEAAAVAEDGVVRVILRRDPFQPVVPDEEDEGVGIVETSAAVETTTTGGGESSGSGTGATGSGSTAGDPACTGGTAETVCDGVVITLVSATDDGAVLQVNGAQYEVQEGGTFAESFRVISIDPPCVSLQYGDESFSVCEGATVLK